MERETYYHAVADPAWGTDPRASRKDAVVEQLDQGADRDHVLEVLADDLGAGGHGELEDAILDVMDAMTGWVHASKRF